jgi:predicted lipid-binding transport protein (Tim44 family)
MLDFTQSARTARAHRVFGRPKKTRARREVIYSRWRGLGGGMMGGPIGGVGGSIAGNGAS